MCQPTNIVRGEGYKELKKPQLMRSLCGGRPGHDTGAIHAGDGEMAAGLLHSCLRVLYLFFCLPLPLSSLSALGPTASLVVLHKNEEEGATVAGGFFCWEALVWCV